MANDADSVQASDEPMRAALRIIHKQRTDMRLTGGTNAHERYLYAELERLQCAVLRAAPVIPAAGAVDDAKDAARFRFLCDNAHRTTFDLTEGQNFINEAIDAAISAQQGPEGKQ